MQEIKYVGSMYLTMLPLIFGGILNMLFVKTPLYKRFKFPIDFNKKLTDGKRILGDNKTYIGFMSMIIFVTINQIILGETLYKIEDLNIHWYTLLDNTLNKNIGIGAITGFIYMASEIPNSFIKRRVGIADGKTEKGLVGKIFLVLDQIDSLIGVFVFLCVCSGLGIVEYFEYLILGGITHITINTILHRLRIRRNI